MNRAPEQTWWGRRLAEVEANPRPLTYGERWLLEARANNQLIQAAMSISRFARSLGR